ncbi:MAG TPA: hypothetical protein VHW01_04040 [Polyangiaceae bacterium]|nr:hypothetical protein [Polyangiaceae bacterium]
MIRTRSASTFLTIATSLLVGLASSPACAADTTVQIPLTALLDARSVTTLTAGKLVVWTLPTDGGGLQNAFATHAVATAQNLPAEVTNTLPDDGLFPANTRHPDVVLHFSNDADAAAPQTHLVMPSAMFNFAVPAATYSKLFLFFNGAAGGTTIKVTFTYSDGTDTQNATIPDYYADVDPADPVIFDLATNQAKWSKTTQIAEANHHNISGAELHPTAGKTLTSVMVERGANGYLVFWGATGVATSPVAGSGGAGGTAGAGGAAGGSGAAATTGGASGASAASGASGASVGAGAGGTAGASGGGGIGGATTSAGAGGALSASTAGANGVSGAANSAGGALVDPVPSSNDSGCGCRLGARGTLPSASWLALGALGWCLGRRRRSTT